MNAEKHDPIPRHVWAISMVVVIGSIMSILDTTIVNVALATLAREQHSTLSKIQWVVTGYMLSLAAVIPVSGWAARRFGAKNIYLISLVLFTLGSALCGQATSTTELVLFRVLQGLGGGMILPLGQLMMAEAAGPQRMGRVMSVVAIPAMLAPIFGPTLGGLIIENASWRWIFYVNVPVGALAVLCAVRVLPRPKRAVTDRLDFLGLVLMAGGLPLITYGLAEIGSLGTFDSSRVIVPILVGVALVAAFVVHALRVPRPLLNLRLYSRPTFASASVAMFCLGGALFGSMILLPLYWQNIRHESVIDTGLLTSPQGIGMVLMMPLVGKLADRHGGGPLALFGVIFTALMTVPFALIGAHTSIVLLFVAMMLRGAGIGFAFMPAMTAAYAALRREELSDATPQLNVLQRVGGSIGTAILAVVLQRAAAGAHTLSAAASAFGTAFWFSVGISALAVIPCVVLVVAERRARALSAAATEIDAGAVAEALAV
jgi:EmrB/QacA subfamily drug resistance transporter